MNVIRESCLDGAAKARGVAVIIDVFRAFSCTPLFFHFGAKQVFLEADAELAISIKKANPDWILAGEVNGVPIEHGDLDNSPIRIMHGGKSMFHNKTVIHRTSAGVTGVAAAMKNCDRVLTGSFVLADALAAYLKKNSPGTVTLVAMGTNGKISAPEDETCADYIAHLLTGSKWDPLAAFTDVIFHSRAQRFLQKEQPYLLPDDIVFCLQKGLFSHTYEIKKIHSMLEVIEISS